MTHIKICGITCVQDAKLAASLDVWGLGFIFANDSARRVEPKTAREITESIRSGAFLSIGVFMDQTEEEIVAIAAEAHLDLIQLHGSEPVEMCKALKSRRCIKAFTSPDEAAFSHPAGYLLVDRPRDSTAPVDLGFAKKLGSVHGKVILAGGLDASNVGEAIKTAAPWGVDVSSGIESAPGFKDEDKMREFVDAVRRADEAAG